MKSIEYYMSLPYHVKVTKIPDSEGGGYNVCIPQLGRYAFTADGETIEEAKANLESVKRDLFEYYLSQGIQIPEPKDLIPEYDAELQIGGTIDESDFDSFIESLALYLPMETEALRGYLIYCHLEGERPDFSLTIDQESYNELVGLLIDYDVAFDLYPDSLEDQLPATYYRPEPDFLRMLTYDIHGDIGISLPSLKKWKEHLEEGKPELVISAIDAIIAPIPALPPFCIKEVGSNDDLKEKLSRSGKVVFTARHPYWDAHIPDLNNICIRGQGSTPEEALDSLCQNIERFRKKYGECGLDFPEFI